jgi:hypothetical protein
LQLFAKTHRTSNGAPNADTSKHIALAVTLDYH